MEQEDKPAWWAQYQRRKEREREARATWLRENQEMIDALGSDDQARRIVTCLKRVGVYSLEDLRSAYEGTFTYGGIYHGSVDAMLKGDPIEEIRGVGAVAVVRIRMALRLQNP